MNNTPFHTPLSQAKTLPASWYTDPSHLQREKELIFWKTWQCVGHFSLVTRIGDFFTYDLYGLPIVVTRDREGILRAFVNVCPHRAGPLAVGKGNRKSLQCRYHGWTFGLDGKLRNAPEFEGVENWQAQDVCLTSIEVEEWGAFIFVRVAPGGAELSAVMDSIADEVAQAGFAIQEMAFIERRDYLIDCNWKVYIDNYLEGYHIPVAHPALFREIDYDQYRVETRRYYSKQHAPIRPAEEASQINGRERRFLRTDGEQDALYYWVFPNLMLNFYPDNMQINIIVPISHEKTLTIFEWYFRQPGSGDGWESMQQSIAFSDQVQKEDIEICETVQRGLNSGFYQQGRFSVQRENGVHHFQALVEEHLRQSPFPKPALQ